MNTRANKRRIMQRLYERFLAQLPSDLGPLTSKDIEAIHRETAKHLPKDALLAIEPPSDLIARLDKFDPKHHGGEAMALAPVGREFGSPDYEKLAISSGDQEAL